MTGRHPITRKGKRPAEADVDVARARWALIFYCWRSLDVPVRLGDRRVFLFLYLSTI
jgi:hypothetical protein